MSRVSTPLLVAVLFAIALSTATREVHGWRFHLVTIAATGLWLGGVAEGQRKR